MMLETFVHVITVALEGLHWHRAFDPKEFGTSLAFYNMNDDDANRDETRHSGRLLQVHWANRMMSATRTKTGLEPPRLQWDKEDPTHWIPSLYLKGKMKLMIQVIKHSSKYYNTPYQRKQERTLYN